MRPQCWSAVAILRLDGLVLGVGESHDREPLLAALRNAQVDARLRFIKSGGDPAAIPWERFTLEIELGQKPDPLIGSTYSQAAREVNPALDGIAVRRGGEWALAHPCVLQSLNAASAPEQTFLSLVMQLGLPARELADIPPTERVGLYKFKAVRVVQPDSTKPAILVHRGSTVVPLRGGPESALEARRAVRGIVEWFDRSVIQASVSPEVQSAGEARALQALGLRGDYLPGSGEDETLFAGPAEQALSAFALAKCAATITGDPATVARARATALKILVALADVDGLERDPLADPKALAWIVLASIELGETLRESKAAVALYANAKDLLAKISSPVKEEALPLHRTQGATSVPQEQRASNILRGDPLEQSLAAAALASLDRIGQPAVDRALLVQSIDELWSSDSRSQIIGILGWLILADQQLGPIPAHHAATARAARAALALVQLGMPGANAPPDDEAIASDIVGAFPLSGFASKGATAQSARPGYALALMLGNSVLTPPAEQNRAREMQLGVVRFMLQLVYDDVSVYLAREPRRALGAIRTAPWDSRVAVAGNAMALLCLEESANSIDLVDPALESTKNPWNP